VVSINPLRGIGELMASAWIDKNGGDSTTVHFIELPFQQSEAALAQGRADAATGSSRSSPSRERRRAFLRTPTRSSVRTTHHRIFRRFGVGASASDVVSRFAAAIRETALWANKNTDNLPRSSRSIRSSTLTS